MNRTQETESFMGTDLMAWCIALANTHMFCTANVVLYACLKLTGMLRRILHLGFVAFSDI
jgi:hypothetical protein